jgi:pSer/pThr/pTyr-binding forkhead associated (FHA) protein
MPKLILQFQDRMLKEYVVGSQVVKIGRLPDNAIAIDNPAVSGHHARVFREGDQIVLEDLKSTNGTFVNRTRVTRHALRHGDVVLVGKHTLVFDESAGEKPVAKTAPAVKDELPELGGTMYLDTRQHRAMLAQMGIGPGGADPTTATLPPSSPLKVAVLRVLAGRADQSEYALEGATSLIGKSDTALVRLKGWFKPRVAVAITRKGDGYVATPLGGKAKINNQPLTGRQDLKDGDVLQVCGLTIEFSIGARS